MLAVSQRLRFAAALASIALTTLFAVASPAQTIDFSLNIFYTTPSNTNSGGTWELVAKANNTSFGISGISARIRNINDGVVMTAPSGTVNGTNAAGFQGLVNSFHPAQGFDPAYRELAIGQVPIFPLPSGSEQSYFYGVGTLANGAPNYPGKPAGSNSIGPPFTSLTNPQHIPWAATNAFNDPAWATAASLLSGTFAVGVTPSFFSNATEHSTGQVFTSLPLTNTAIGNEALATAITTIVRTNFAPAVNSADYNRDGIVDGLDYILWRKTQGATVTPGTGADGNSDGMVNMLDYDLWRSHFGNPMGSGSGVGLSSNVPEPAGFVLLTIGALIACTQRRNRFDASVNS